MNFSGTPVENNSLIRNEGSRSEYPIFTNPLIDGLANMYRYPFVFGIFLSENEFIYFRYHASVCGLTGNPA
jgi:hypothetical protein